MTAALPTELGSLEGITAKLSSNDWFKVKDLDKFIYSTGHVDAKRVDSPECYDVKDKWAVYQLDDGMVFAYLYPGFLGRFRKGVPVFFKCPEDLNNPDFNLAGLHIYSPSLDLDLITLSYEIRSEPGGKGEEHTIRCPNDSDVFAIGQNALDQVRKRYYDVANQEHTYISGPSNKSDRLTVVVGGS
jgi:hypothetical protein